MSEVMLGVVLVSLLAWVLPAWMTIAGLTLAISWAIWTGSTPDGAGGSSPRRAGH